MKRSLAILIVVGMVITFEATITLAQDTTKSKTGQEEYMSSCASCHPNGGNVGRPAKPVKGSDRLKNFQSLQAWIRKPSSGMPSFPASRMSDEQAQKLYDYILSASKDEWK
ncbi:MAG TPA: c-type cytochrome [Syntrophorhabdaceae bacterium]|nr:c-type cytochrome [Syntrophorhabdaceae bacterium]